jgi:hypothetical protein
MQQPITPQGLSAFLQRARSTCSYEAGSATREQTLADGTRLIGPYREGSLTYTDHYGGPEGFIRFQGTEEIRADDRLVWRRTYEGGIVIAADAQKVRDVYGFLKRALRLCPPDQPYRRGPPRLEEGSLVYEDECQGTIEYCVGQERILEAGEEIYRLDYAGDTM